MPPHDGRILPQGFGDLPSSHNDNPSRLLSPERAPTSLHRQVDPAFIAQLQQTRVETRIAQAFSLEYLNAIDNLLQNPQSLSAWIAIHNEIAFCLDQKPLFIEGLPAGEEEMTYEVFSSAFAPYITQDRRVVSDMVQFFAFLNKRMHPDVVD
ncbi:MAG: hypothetical protein WC101_03210 [Candidatus Gracilibacteria bacterium]